MDEPQTKNIMYNAVNKRTKKQLIEEHKKDKNKKRVESESWHFDPEHYKYENQLKNIKDLHSNNYNFKDEITKLTLQQINKKIYGYKQQDIIKKLYNEKEFVNLESVINKMIECELKCYYCSTEMNVLYDISREIKQWTIDRIDNDLGHNLTNYYLACLDCNLKRRRRSDEKFLFTKQMKLIKVIGENNKDNDTSLV